MGRKDLGPEAFWWCSHTGQSRPVLGSGPFKSNIVGVEYTPEGMVYTLVHVTGVFKTTAFINDFVAMQ
jgi:hypothetical protein